MPQTTAEQPATDPAWTDAQLAANPHLADDKATRVQKMFAAIAPSYDLNNRVHSLGRDQAWRRAAVKMAGLQGGETVVDVACGTGDLSLAFANQLYRIKAFEPGSVTGIDFTYEMLPIARRKAGTKLAWIKSHPKPTYLSQTTRFLQGDAMNLPLPDRCCDVVSIAFGIRNVADPRKAMQEFVRVLRPGGRVIVLEFSLPTNPVMRAGYNFYFKHVMPRTAALVARDRSGAYKYLPKSVSTFIDRAGMVKLMAEAGLMQIEHKPLTCGIAVCYRGVKPAAD